jgi:hypothetical protein
MRKAIIAAMAAAIALTPISVAIPVASGAPPCDPNSPTENMGNAACHACVDPAMAAHDSAAYAACFGQTPPARATTPAQAPSNPPTRAPNTTPVQAPNNSPTKPAQAPPTKPAVVKPPKGLDAPPQAIAAAKAAPATRIDPANPPPPPTQKDFTQQVQSVIKTHNAHIDFVNGLAHPRHWDYIDYDADRHPVLYNPLTEAITFRYFYGGDYREVYVAAGSSVVLNVAGGGVFPFTAVGDDYLTSGSFYGGSPPALYQDVAAYVPAYNQTVQVGKVEQVGHDDSQPAGSQDTFMLDDSTLAWGQATNPSDGGQITVTKTQTLPGVGPTDDGKSLVDLAEPAHQQPTHTWWLWPLGGGVLVIAAGLVTWMVIRRKRGPDPSAGAQ